MQDILSPEKGWFIANNRVKVPQQLNLLVKLSAPISKFFGKQALPDIFKVLSIHSSLFFPWLHFASKLMPYGLLPARERELIILRVAWLCRSRYEWAQHIEIGQQKAKLNDDDIICVSKGSDAFDNIKEKTIIDACDELIANKIIEESTWNMLSSLYSEKEIIEITMLIGHYEMLAGFLNSAGIELEEQVASYLTAFHNRIADKLL